MMLISTPDARHPGALCEVIRETPSAYTVNVLSAGKPPLSVEGGHVAGAQTWVVKRNVLKLNVSREDYGDYLASHSGLC